MEQVELLLMATRRDTRHSFWVKECRKDLFMAFGFVLCDLGEGSRKQAFALLVRYSQKAGAGL